MTEAAPTPAPAQKVVSARVNLAKLIGEDLKRYWFSALLWMAVFVSSFAIILTTNMTRNKTAEYNALMSTRDALEIEWRHLLLEQGTLAEHSRVAELASEKLQMARPAASLEKVIEE